MTSSMMKHHTNDDPTIKTFFDHSSAERVNTNTVIARSLKQQYPDLDQIIVSVQNCNLLSFANSTGKANFSLIEQDGKKTTVPHTLLQTRFVPPSRRTEEGKLSNSVIVGKYSYTWEGTTFLVYAVDGRDGVEAYPQEEMFYILTSQKSTAMALVEAVGKWGSELHDEIWVFDGGYWQKSAELFDSVKTASWDNVIMDSSMKQSIIDDHLSFFSSRDMYKQFGVPWKRGVIYHGPPGNGKTISIKAMMNSLYNLKDPVPSLYVRSLTSMGGSEYSVKSIFAMARRMAPCYLVFEDLDSIITDQVRSYFLNEVDGLKTNDGVFMLGSTNHLDRLDPGISKRPSRFDRKYFFSDPNKKDRIAYCHFWQHKLKDNKKVEFPDSLCEPIAGITDKFSFAYMQEAFVASLLAIARKAKKEEIEVGVNSMDIVENMEGDWVGVRGESKEGSQDDDDDGNDDDDDEDLDKYILWTEMKEQVAILRESIETTSSPR